MPFYTITLSCTLPGQRTPQGTRKRERNIQAAAPNAEIAKTTVLQCENALASAIIRVKEHTRKVT